MKTTLPIGNIFLLPHERYNWMHEFSGGPGVNGRTIACPRGRLMGGCTSVNGTVYMRGHPLDYDEWAALTGDDSWRWEAVLPLFKRSEDHHAGPNDTHGHAGEWRVEPQRLRWDILESFAQAAVAAGIPRTRDFNTGDNFGVGYFEVNQKKGVRWNASKAFLRPVLGRHNLTVVTGAHVKRLTLAQGRCTGLVYELGGREVTVAAGEEVVLAAGAVNSPHLLELSGIGAPAVLAACGLPVAHALPGVGENLQDHLQLRSVYKVSNVRTLNTRAASWLLLSPAIWRAVRPAPVAGWRLSQRAKKASRSTAPTRPSRVAAWPPQRPTIAWPSL